MPGVVKSVMEKAGACQEQDTAATAMSDGELPLFVSLMANQCGSCSKLRGREGCMKKGTDDINLHPCDACGPMQVRCSALFVLALWFLLLNTEYHRNDHDLTGILFLRRKRSIYQGGCKCMDTPLQTLPPLPKQFKHVEAWRG